MYFLRFTLMQSKKSRRYFNRSFAFNELTVLFCARNKEKQINLENETHCLEPSKVQERQIIGEKFFFYFKILLRLTLS